MLSIVGNVRKVR